MTSTSPSSTRSRRQRSTAVRLSSRSLFATVPPRVFGHALVVVVCLVVAYAGRTGRLSDQLGLAFAPGTTVGTGPSALASPGLGQSGDALVRPPLADTQAGSSGQLQIMHYEVQPGDTIAGLAERFDISENTIVWTNGILPNSRLDPGQQLIILPVSGVLYTVSAGDTVDGIAQRFLSDSQAIAAVNQLTDPTHPGSGLQLIIPGGRIDEAARPDVSTRSIARPNQGIDGEASQAAPPPAFAVSAVQTPLVATALDSALRGPMARRPAVPAALVPVSYTVVDGDTLSSIAAKFGVSADSIAAASGLQGNEDSLGIDQKLVIPPVPGAVHVVQDGDTLDEIAERYAADAAAIVRANLLSEPYLLQIGQMLVIPGGKISGGSTVAAPAIVSESTYQVQEGDTVSSIADAFGVDMQSVIDTNSLVDPYILQPGQQVVIRGATRSGADNSTRSAPASRPAPIAAGAPAVAAAPAVVAAPAQTVRPAAVVVAPAKPAPAPASSLGWSIVSVASRYLGYPYVWGGTSPSGFDCSGFVWYIYRRAGVPIPRDMWGQLQSGTRISRSNLQPGDIVFFDGTYTAGLSHDGIYIGGGRFIHAADYGVGVEVSSFSNSYYASRYFGATRPW